MKRIFPIFIVAAPALVLVVCAQNGPDARSPKPPAAARPTTDVPTSEAAEGRVLFLRNCAHCHGADARGDEGPDLHSLDWTDKQITTRILNGKKGQMTAFRDKLNQSQIKTVIVYLRTLK